MYGQQYAPQFHQNDEYAHQQVENKEQRQPTFSLLYGAHGCPASRVRPIEAEVEVPVFAEDAAKQEEWWAAKARYEEERGADEFEDKESDEDGEDVFGEAVVVEKVQQTHQTYAAIQTARQKALDLEAYARVGQSQRETFRNGYMALGMRYRGVRRARADAVVAEAEALHAASSQSLPSLASPSSGEDDASSSSAACDDEEDRNASPDDDEASSSSSESSEEYDSDADADSDYSSSRSTSSSSSRTRARASPYARASRNGATARLVDSVASFFGRMDV
ncbi:hypothetical protein DFH06DRAFT_1195957 [Mycena polygramma]|nr:hypothetical protein DFH06DRAFT_1195957 [Mycena polygramma]